MPHHVILTHPPLMDRFTISLMVFDTESAAEESCFKFACRARHGQEANVGENVLPLEVGR